MKKRFESYWYKDIREMKNLKELLAGSLSQFADNPAFWVKAKKGASYESISYRLLDHDICSLGAQLGEMGLDDEPIAIMGQGCYEWIATYLAVMNGRGVVVPIDKELSGPEIANLLRASNCKTIFCTQKECKKLAGIQEIETLVVMEFYGDRTSQEMKPETGIKSLEKYYDLFAKENDVKVYAWRTLLAEGDALDPEKREAYRAIPIDPDAMKVILFTSGTTGNPKGVMLSHRNIAYNIMDVCRIAHVLETDKTLSILPIHHTYECTLGMLLVLYRGASTAFCEGMKYISKNLKEAQATVIIVVPRVLEMIYGKIQKGLKEQNKEKIFGRVRKLNHFLQKYKLDMSHVFFRQALDELGGKLRFVVTGAAALSPNIIRMFEDMGVIVLQGYGMTECTPLLTGTPMSAPKERYKKAGSVGVPVHLGELKIENPDADGIGEIVFRGPNVMLGYYNMPKETAEVLTEDGWLHTGDLGFQDPEGWVYITGRKKNVIVTKTGENVYPEELEEVLNQNPYIIEAMVYPHKVTGEEIVGVQVLPEIPAIAAKLGHEPTKEELDSFIKNEIADFNETLSVYKRIRDVIVREEDFVRTTTLKIKRQDNM